MIFTRELIGENITVVESTNVACLGISGQVIDESKNTLVVQTESGTKTLLKQSVTIRLDSGEIIECKTIMKRSVDRIKGK